MLNQSDELLWELWLSKYWLPCLRAADRVGIFGELNVRSATCEQLAETLQLNERVTGGVLQLLESLKLLVKRDGVYALTAESSTYLVSGEPAYWGPALGIGPPSSQEEAIHKALCEGTEAATGSPDPNGLPQPGESQLPVVSWAKGEVEKERAHGVGQVMHSHSLSSAATLAQLISLDRTSHLLDVGGGSGCFSIASISRDSSCENVNCCP